jgi:hypothetical protein
MSNMQYKYLSENDYYSLHDVLSRNAMWNFILGARGLGKTYAAADYVLKKWLNKRWEFIYLRRTEEEVKKAKISFWNDMAQRYPQYVFRNEGMLLQICLDPYEDSGENIEHNFIDGKTETTQYRTLKKRLKWETCGYIIALSTAGALKSMPFPNVHTIIYDEIFPTAHGNVGQYLGSETELFQEFYSTVDRWQDRVRVLALSNATNVANIYFSTYGIKAEEQHKAIQLYAKGYIAVEIADYKGFSSKVKNTRFGQLIRDTEYGQYAIDNEFRNAHSELMGVVDKRRDGYNFTIITNMGTMRIWSHPDADFNTCAIASDLTPAHERCRTTVPSKVSPDCPLLSIRDALSKRLIQAYRGGTMRFESAEQQAIFMDLFGSKL